MREIRKKLGVIGREGGLGEEGQSFSHFEVRVRVLKRTLPVELQELDLEGEWDAEKHDQQMNALYEGDDPIGEDVSPIAISDFLPLF